ncbi:MAG TPA: ABC transporter permease [Ktedonobacteraceae bacterium]|nr:ABC transporter permease [Ktedonobacteraceae bacterium]
MLQYVLLLLRRQRGRSVLTSGGFLLAACAVILLSATTQTTVIQARQIINKNWRPSYDLVVLPSQANLPSGQTVPADFLEGYNGGISVQQYEQIKSLPDIAVAAPIAFLGYALSPVPALNFAPHALAPGYYREDLTLTAFNGHQHIIERHESLIYGVFTTCAITSETGAAESLMQQNVVVGTCGAGSAAPTEFPSLDDGTFLFAAIDPAEEEQLLHLNPHAIEGRMLTNQDGLTLAKNLTGNFGAQSDYTVPLLINRSLPGNIALDATLTRLGGPLDPQQVLDSGGYSYLVHLPHQQTMFQGSVPLVQNNPQAFSDAALTWNGQTWQPEKYGSSTGGGNNLQFLYTPSGLTYRPVAAPDGQVGYTLVPSQSQSPASVLSTLHLIQGNTALPSDKQGAEVYFRDLHAMHTLTDTPDSPSSSVEYYPNIIGQFDGSTLSAQFNNVLNWLPENTYASPPAVLRYDTQGHPVKPTTLLPTTNPAGYLLQPPLALTTLKAAQQIVGNRLISVIRVRLTSNVTPDDAGWKRVSQVAQEIHQRTGLQVFITLGSSPAPTLVYIPGLKKGQDGSTKDIPPVGWVQERWIAIGAGIVYLNQLGETQLLLLGAVLLVCLGYLAVTMSSLVSAQRRELAVLSALGWRPWHPAGMFLAQAIVLSLCGGVVGIGLALLLVALIGASPPWQIVAWTMPGVLGLALLSALYPLWQIWRIQPAEVLRAGTTVTKESTTSRLNRWNASFWSRLPAVGGMALRNLSRSRGRAVIAIGSLFLSAVLLTVMVDGILAFRQTLQGTLLGDYVLLQTAVPQIAGAMFAILLTFLSVADLLLLQVRERQKEIGLLQAVGWRAKVVQRLFVQEGMTLAVVGAVPGVLVALGVLMTQHAAQGAIPAPLVGLGAVVLMLIVAGLATIPAIRAVNRLPMMDVLRGE